MVDCGAKDPASPSSISKFVIIAAFFGSPYNTAVHGNHAFDNPLCVCASTSRSTDELLSNNSRRSCRREVSRVDRFFSPGCKKFVVNLGRRVW